MEKPTTFQQKMFWAALTAMAFLTIGLTIVFVGWLVISAISFMRPVVLPLAVAGVLAYLLEPVVKWLTSYRLGRQKISRGFATTVVFAFFFALVTGILIWIVPGAWQQGNSFAVNFPEYLKKGQEFMLQSVEKMNRIGDMKVFQKPDATAPAPDAFTLYASKAIQDGTLWIEKKVPEMMPAAGMYLWKSFSGVLGVFGFLLSLVLVPVFLFFFLLEGPAIASGWSAYLPLRASPLKSEIVSLLSEINDYLISFFRGQLIVSLIDGALIAVALLILGVDYSVLIGLMVGILGLIPYVGVLICWIPAVCIAAFQFHDWFHPGMVTVIFILVNQLEGLFIAPKIVGESVGLHPLTIIISVLAWSLVLGGLLGALLAVPLTATIKVLLTRYFWDRPPSPSMD